MPKYKYTAKSIKGEEKKGTIEAENIHELSRNLKAQGFILIQAKLQDKPVKEGFKIDLPIFGVSLSEKMFFIRNLKVMTTAGVPLPRAIKSLSEQVKNKLFRESLLDIREQVTKGKSLSESMATHPDIFPELLRGLIKVGEESGTLEDVLGTLAFQMERENKLKSTVKGAMIYPAVIILAMIGVGLLMLITIVPKLSDTFKDLGVELPATTQFVIGLGGFLAQNFLFILIGLIILVIIFLRALKIESFKKIVDKIFLKIPVLGPIITNTNSAHMLRTMSSLIKAGSQMPRALEITSTTLGNFYFKKSLHEAADKVRKGEKLSDILRSYSNIYPLIIIQMVGVGEETGETSSVLGTLADFFEEEVSNATKNLTSVIEPILMIIIGTVVGFFAVSMIQPMYSLLGEI